MLQWGHAFSSVESPSECFCATIALDSFNGATLFQAWRAVLEMNLEN